MSIPHLAYPFRQFGSRFATVEQDSSAEVAQCVYAVLGTTPGDRADFPEMGIEDPTFSTLDLDDIRSEVESYEPRAELLTDSDFDGLVQRVRTLVSVR